SLDSVFAALDQRWGRLDFLVHAIAFSDKDELTGKYIETSRGNFLRTLDISCFSFTDVCRRAVPMILPGCNLLTLNYAAAERSVGRGQRRGPPCRLRLSRRRHEGGRRARYRARVTGASWLAIPSARCSAIPAGAKATGRRSASSSMACRRGSRSSRPTSSTG